ncbi:cupin domain-containing protein [Patescibacteria group bacterium]|nr:cupin domain-containing protein [Patescibacteria group bacterium]
MPNIKNVKKLIEYPKEGILSKVISSVDNVEVTLFSMAAGTDMSEHTSAKTGIIYVIEGKGVFNLKGEDIIMEPGVMISMPKNAVHSLKAEINTTFLLILSS